MSDHQERYDSEIASRHGGWGGYGSEGAGADEAAQPEPEWTDPDPGIYEPEPWEQPAEQYVDFSQPDYYAEPDPHEDLRQVIREELSPAQDEIYNAGLEVYDQRHQERLEQQAASAEVEQAEAAQQGLENLDGLINAALGGRGTEVLQQFPEFRTEVVERLAAEWETMVTAGTAQGFDPAMVSARLEAQAPAYVAAVVKSVQSDFGTAQAFRESRQNFRGARS